MTTATTWKDAMLKSATNSIEHSGSGAMINDQSDDTPKYDVILENGILCDIPEAGVQRILEEFDIPQRGWK